jgi:hypothetical protein
VSPPSHWQSSESTSGSKNGVEESTWTNNLNAAQPKTRTESPVYYDDEEYDTEIPVVRVDTEWQPKKKRPILTPKKANSTPVSPQYSPQYWPQYSIPGFTFNNDSGNMSNVNVGNVYNSTISDSYNNNSVNVTGKGLRRLGPPS